MATCIGWLWRSVFDEDGTPTKETVPYRCDHPVTQTLFRCGVCLRVIHNDVKCDGCRSEEIETERYCDSHRLSDRDIAYSRGITLPAPTQRQLLAQAIGIWE